MPSCVPNADCFRVTISRRYLLCMEKQAVERGAEERKVDIVITLDDDSTTRWSI